MSADENKTCVLRQFEELWNNGQVDRVEDFFAEDFMNFGQQYQDARPIVKHIVPLIAPLQGPTLAPNGKTFKVKHIHRFRLKEGKIIDHFAVRDDLGMFQQLGHLGALSG